MRSIASRSRSLAALALWISALPFADAQPRLACHSEAHATAGAHWLMP
jgi:hypothetical protein